MAEHGFIYDELSELQSISYSAYYNLFPERLQRDTVAWEYFKEHPDMFDKVD
jgi:hypothetical protein